jgi:hypothetical protein
MRTLAILGLAVGFAAVVILPNEIGTDERPALGGKHVVSKVHVQKVKPRKGDLAASVVLVQVEGLARCSGCISEARLGLVPPAVSQLSPRLLI